MTSGNRAEGGEMQVFSCGSAGATFEPPNLDATPLLGMD